MTGAGPAGPVGPEGPWAKGRACNQKDAGITNFSMAYLSFNIILYMWTGYMDMYMYICDCSYALLDAEMQQTRNISSFGHF